MQPPTCLRLLPYLLFHRRAELLIWAKQTVNKAIPNGYYYYDDDDGCLLEELWWMRIDWIYSELCVSKFVCIYGRRGTIPQAKRQGVTRFFFCWWVVIHCRYPLPEGSGSLGPFRCLSPLRRVQLPHVWPTIPVHPCLLIFSLLALCLSLSH